MKKKYLLLLVSSWLMLTGVFAKNVMNAPNDYQGSISSAVSSPDIMSYGGGR